ncbi:hypothetical protein EXS54_02010 [Patescibacteria group bacterium]|nr:hypothetical protein [Patescibacteria group bacterium]
MRNHPEQASIDREASGQAVRTAELNPLKTAASIEWALAPYGTIESELVEHVGVESSVGAGKENADVGFVSPDRSFGLLGDGVGSSGADVASAAITEEYLRERLTNLPEAMNRNDLTEAFTDISEGLHDVLTRQSELTGQSHEVVATWYRLYEEDGKQKAVIANVGDCQAHRTRNGKTKELTRFYQRGLPKRKKRPALGRTRHQVEVQNVRLKPGDTLSLMSNGIRKNLKRKMISKVLRKTDSAAEAAERLVRAAGKRGRSRDAATAVVITV